MKTKAESHRDRVNRRGCCTIMDVPGVTVIQWSRELVWCLTNGCTARAITTCQYPLSGRRTGEICDRPICQRCSIKVDGKHYCPSHARLAGKEGA